MPKIARCAVRRKASTCRIPTRGKAQPTPWAREQAEALAAFRAASAADRSRRLVSVELLGLLEALHHPELAADAREAVAEAYRAAHGEGDGSAMCECFACLAPWSRAPAAVALVQVSRPPLRGLGLLCTACVGGPLDLLRQRLADAVKREGFVDDAATEVPACSVVTEGGSA